MTILLLGEYSKLHNSLKSGLEYLGHEVTLVGTGDNFKNFPVDKSFAPKLTQNNPFFRFCKRVVYRLFKLNLEETEKGLRFYFLLPKLKGFDHLQLINSNALQTHPRWNLWLLKRLFKQNKKKALLVCGEDTPVTDYLLKKELKYSVLTPYFEDPSLKRSFNYVLKYSRKPYRKLFEFVHKNSTTLISSDLDYKIPLDALKFENTMIPNPIVPPEKKMEPQPVSDKIVIFLGINRLSKIKKGIPFFEEALTIIRKKYPQKVEIQIVENLPYAEYVKTYEKAHIFLDMVYYYDQGYNALEAMAKGKVIFTGAETEFLEHYGLKEDEVCINALPDVDYLVKKLSWLIEDPSKIEEIGKNAQRFVQREHDYVKVAERYLSAWRNNEAWTWNGNYTG